MNNTEAAVGVLRKYKAQVGEYLKASITHYTMGTSASSENSQQATACEAVLPKGMN